MMRLMKFCLIGLDVVVLEAGALNASSQWHIKHSHTPPLLSVCEIAKDRRKEGAVQRWHANLAAAAAAEAAEAAAVATVCGVVKVRPGEKFSHALRTTE